MMFATLPDPSSPAAIGWLFIICASSAFGLNQALELIARARGNAPHPPNEQIQGDLDALELRLEKLEEWQTALGQRLADDKTEILKAGEERGDKIGEQLDKLRSDMSDHINALPAQIIAILRNTGAIGRK